MVRHEVPVYELDVSLPSLEGKCRLAVLDCLLRYSDELAEKTAQSLQLSEGASPVALEDIAEVVESESVPEQSPDLAISPSLDTSDHLSPANTISDSDLVTSLFAKGWRKVVVGLARALVVRESVKLRREEEPTKLSALLKSMKFMEL